MGGNAPAASVALDAVAGIVCLVWLLVILKVPWDLYFETRNVLFEMKRSAERHLAVNEDRRRYVQRLQRRTLAIAVTTHFVSAGAIALLTYWSNGKVGYYFAVFYIAATFFRPASRSYYFLMAQLKEIGKEVKYPREDVVKLLHQVEEVRDKIKSLKEIEIKSLEGHITRIDKRILAGEETAHRFRTELNDAHSRLTRTEQSFQSRIQMLSDEMERSLMNAFDNQNIVKGLSAFARLIKEA
jgi:hypothetical protein